ncbi:hypothetical protein [Pseudoalteromonas rubra]|uniref:Uncharacterized protein n=1 Tax=Pseudoalteromonas rubra TaxID=43658 RepID=A0A0F4QZZ3_9GAMM|nr:hypothetical protein [Pseudoalteromonas rubra]KJZ12137.1 hypothetical protein TW77_03465 [Pseudoalteromonas rubra]
MKVILLLITLIFTCVASADEQQAPPLNPAYKGEHGMVLMNRGSRIYASNFPSYGLPNDIHVVYRLENPDVAFLSLIRDSKLITIKPEPFNLQRLERGEEVTIMADVYEGHYARDGRLVYPQRQLVLSDKLFARKLSKLEPASQWHEYDVIEINKTERIYVHKIQQRPSFNHLIFVDLTGACLQKFRASKRVPSAGELAYKFINCGTLKQLFYDAESYM